VVRGFGKLKIEMMSSVTVRTLSKYQICELSKLILQGSTIEHIGRVDETAALIVEYRGGLYYDGVCTTISIPQRPENIGNEKPTEDADFEVVQPKQIENATD
jgi:hypothetical protein